MKKICKGFLAISMLLSLLPTTAFTVKAKETVEKVVTTIDDNDARIQYSEGWNPYDGGSDVAATEHWTNKKYYDQYGLAWFELTFTGSEIELFGKKEALAGMYQVTIDKDTDNEITQVVDGYSEETLATTSLVHIDGLTEGEHTLRFEVIKQVNPNIAASWEEIDNVEAAAAVLKYIEVTSYQDVEYEEVTTFIDNADTGTGLNKVNYSTGERHWNLSSGVATDYNGTQHWTDKRDWGAPTPLPSFEIEFEGTEIELFGKKDKLGGMFEATIDEGTPNEKTVKIDTYSANTLFQENWVKFDGLTNGKHTLKVQMIPEINSMFGNYEDQASVALVFDYAKVTSQQVVDPDKLFTTEISDADIGDDVFEFTYSNGWGTSTGYPEQFYDGNEHWNWVNVGSSAYYEIKFYGSSIELYGNTENTNGICTPILDGVTLDTFHPYSEERKTKQKIYELNNLEEKEHTLKILIDNTNGTEAVSAEIDHAIVKHKAIAPSAVQFVKDEVIVEAGVQTVVEATTSPSYATNSKIEYSVEDATIATVDQEGVVTPLKVGTTTIYAHELKSGLKASMTLIVEPAVVGLSAFMHTTDYHALQEDYEMFTKIRDYDHTDTAWRGDEINSKIVTVTRQEDVHNVEITASDFTNGINKIDQSNIDIRWVKDVDANIGRGNPAAPIETFPAVIHKGGKTDIEAGKVKSAWVNITIPEDTKPGIYTGTLTLVADELEEPIEFEYEIEVFDFILPSSDDVGTQIQIWQHPFAVAEYYEVAEEDYFTEEHFKYMRASMQEYASMGGKDLVVNIVEEAWNHQSYTSDPSMIKWTMNKEGELEFDYTWFDAWVQFNIDCGVLDPSEGRGQIKAYSMVPWGNQIEYFDEATQTIVKKGYAIGSDEWTFMWTSFINDFMRHTEELGWFDITYISMDERGRSELEPALNLIKSIKNDEGVAFKTAAAFNFKVGGDFEFLDKIDDLSVGQSYVDPTNDDMRNLSAHRREKGLITTLYTCTGHYPSSFIYSDMAENKWLMWFTLGQDTDGYMRWAWDNWTEDPLTIAEYRYWEPEDGYFVYPVEKEGAKDGTYYYSTPKYEILKEGINDINKAKYLQTLSPELDSKIDELTKSLVRSNPGGNGYGSATYASEADRQLLLSEVARMDAGLDEMTRNALNTTADYSEVDTALENANNLDSNLYTNFDEVTTAINGVVRDLDFTKQDQVDAMAKAINDAINGLTYKGADYSAVDTALDSVNNLDSNLYTNFDTVNTAVEGVERNLDITHQAKVDEMAKAINDAITGLTYKAADYSELDKLMLEAEAINLDLLTNESAEALKSAIQAADELSRDLNITQQAKVDEVANNLKSVIENIKEKPVVDPDEDKEDPGTGDTSNIFLYGFMMLLALLGIVLIKRKA